VKSTLASFLKSLTAPEKFVILILLLFGVVAALNVPLSAGYDEETHFIRAWEMAHYYFIPNEQLGAQLPFPAIYWELSYRRQPIVQAVEPGFWSKYEGLSLDSHDYIYANVETRSVYSPALLLPQALTLRLLGLSMRLPALTVYYACRFIGLLCYLLLGWLAVRFIPFGKWLLAVLIAAPMALFQASTISADTISNGIGFFFLGCTLAIANRKELGWKEWAALAGLIALLFLAKVNLVFLALLPFLLTPPSKYRMKGGYVLLGFLVLALFLVEVGGWNLLAYSRFTRALQGADPTQQILFILSSPLLFIKIIALDVWTNTLAYLQGWVGVYGYDYWPVPGLTYILFPLAVIASLFLEEAPSLPDKKTRLVLILLFALGYLLTIISLYIAFTPVKSLVVAGVQGRYFTPIMPLLLLALLVSSRGMSSRAAERNPATQSPLARIRIPSSIPAGLALFALVLYTGGLVLSYQVTCGSQYYRLELCYQPQYKNWAPEASSSPPISPAVSLTQEIVPACNGMKEMRVWVNSTGSDPSGTTTLILRAPTQQKDLVRQTFTNADIPKDNWLTVSFNPERQSDNQLYLLTLQGSSADGIQVAYSLKPEYLTGKLFENDTAIGQDMIFQYGCVAGLQKLLQLGN
jgi:uncharacterized membrane protein